MAGSSVVRVVGIDLGTRRIGVAVSDPSGTLASPYEVVERGRDHVSDHARLAGIVEEVGAGRVVVGLPLALSGQPTLAAVAVQAEVEELARALPVPVGTHDERLTTVVAHSALAAGGASSRKRRGIVDMSAAAVLLQSWLDGPSGRVWSRPRDELSRAGNDQGEDHRVTERTK